MTEPSRALAAFDTTIATATDGQAVFSALQSLTQTLVGAKLFTVSLLDMQAELARRAYSSDPLNYPASGTKPFNYGPWFDTVHKERAFFVANRIEDIAKVFFDHELIASLGCQSVVNMPVVLGDKLVATVNMLDVADYYTPERVQTIADTLSLPAKLAVLLAQNLDALPKEDTESDASAFARNPTQTED